MNRRRFMARLATASVAASLPGFAQAPVKASLTIDETKKGPTIPLDFTGLAYESAQLANPAFFSASNQQLIELFRGLSPNGNLRLGRVGRVSLGFGQRHKAEAARAVKRNQLR